MKRLLKKLDKDKQDYYNFLAHECFAGLSDAEDDFVAYRFASSAVRLFYSSEFFWKALITLSNKYLEKVHEITQVYMSQISEDLITGDERIKIYNILTKFPEIRRELAIYGYYEWKGKQISPPSKVFAKESVKEDLEAVSYLVNRLRRIHFYQVFDPPVKIAVLSGYVEKTGYEKPCEARGYTWSGYRKAKEWIDDLNELKAPDGSRLFEASLASVGELSSGIFPVTINPFGETYPEKGKVEGLAFEGISQYIREGGIFVNSAGHPFIYTWDVETGDWQPVISFIGTRIVSEIQPNGTIIVKEGAVIPKNALLLARKFGLELVWDDPVAGPQEVDIEYDEYLGDKKQKMKAMVFRPAKQISSSVIPLVRSQTTMWGEVYPVLAVKYGRGFLIHTGMSLDGEREYKILLDIINRIAVKGYEVLVDIR